MFSVLSISVLSKDCSPHNPKTCKIIMFIDLCKLSMGVNVSVNGSMSLCVSLLINCQLNHHHHHHYFYYSLICPSACYLLI